MGGTAEALEVFVERELYTPTRLFLFTRFAGLLAQRAGSGSPKVFADEVATVAGETSGTWTRPDIAALAISRGVYVPHWRADLHTFEVKTAGALDVTGAHEARAQGRLGHYAWLVFQAVGRAAPDGHRFEQVMRSANELGVGTIYFRNSTNPEEWQIGDWPRRTEADNAVADAFVRERFAPGARSDIVQYLTAQGWPSNGAA